MQLTCFALIGCTLFNWFSCVSEFWNAQNSPKIVGEGVYSDATQLNSTSSWVALSFVAINGALAVQHDSILLLRKLKLGGGGLWRRFRDYNTHNTPVSIKRLSIFIARHVCIARTMPSQDVCLSVCPSHAGIVSKWLYISSKFFHHRSGSPTILVFPHQMARQYSDAPPPPNVECKGVFSTNISLYLTCDAI